MPFYIVKKENIIPNLLIILTKCLFSTIFDGNDDLLKANNDLVTKKENLFCNKNENNTEIYENNIKEVNTTENKVKNGNKDEFFEKKNYKDNGKDKDNDDKDNDDDKDENFICEIISIDEDDIYLQRIGSLPKHVEQETNIESDILESIHSQFITEESSDSGFLNDANLINDELSEHTEIDKPLKRFSQKVNLESKKYCGYEKEDFTESNETLINLKLDNLEKKNEAFYEISHIDKKQTKINQKKFDAEPTSYKTSINKDASNLKNKRFENFESIKKFQLESPVECNEYQISSPRLIENNQMSPINVPDNIIYQENKLKHINYTFSASSPVICEYKKIPAENYPMMTKNYTNMKNNLSCVKNKNKSEENDRLSLNSLLFHNHESGGDYKYHLQNSKMAQRRSLEIKKQLTKTMPASYKDLETMKEYQPFYDQDMVELRRNMNDLESVINSINKISKNNDNSDNKTGGDGIKTDNHKIKGYIKTDKDDIKTDKGEIKSDKGEIKTDKGDIKTDKCEIKSDKGEIKSDKGYIKKENVFNKVEGDYLSREISIEKQSSVDISISDKNQNKSIILNDEIQKGNSENSEVKNNNQTINDDKTKQYDFIQQSQKLSKRKNDLWKSVRKFCGKKHKNNG
ncbi:hypothetical protein DMUE_2874 [Dictyocoela muelleri]|nr:hypothetical protein DMUE_2874 [Dictyocoela muelleri]